MANFLDNLRKKTVKERQKIALITSVFLALIIFSGWFVMTWNNFNKLSKDESGQTESKFKSPSPLASIKESFSKITETSYNQFLELKNKFNIQTDIFTETVDFESEGYNDIKPMENKIENKAQ